METNSRKPIAGRIILAFVIALIAAYVIQATPLSFRNLIISSSVLTGPELGMLEFSVGFLNSLLVTAVSLLALKRPAIRIALSAGVAQFVWIEWAYGFNQGGDTLVEAILRYAEHFGVLLGAITTTFLCLRFWERNNEKSTSSTSSRGQV